VLQFGLVQVAVPMLTEWKEQERNTSTGSSCNHWWNKSN